MVSLYPNNDPGDFIKPTLYYNLFKLLDWKNGILCLSGSRKKSIERETFFLLSLKPSAK